MGLVSTFCGLEVKGFVKREIKIYKLFAAMNMMKYYCASRTAFVVWGFSAIGKTKF